jgi:hypothetical protein
LIFKTKNNTLRSCNLSFDIQKRVLLFLFLFFTVFNNFAQLSPGKLSKAHSKLKGLTNCTQCHSLGNKISNQKCLACHKELGDRVSVQKGFHVSVQVKGKECIICHSEHHGEGFDMLRFDKKTFNHNLTGYELKGGHKTKISSCNECHKPANIANAKLKKNLKTYLGLSTNCASCHEDYHQKTLSTNNCATCHDFNDFKKAPLFNHAKTNFALLGQHTKAECVACHKAEIKNGKKFVNFAGINSNCVNCHKDVHKGKFGTNCKSCHSEDSFNKITPNNNFNHKSTGFELEGKHKEINCTKCHNKSVGYQEYTKTNNITCITCHKDVHEGKLGTDCKSCHNQNSFLLKNKTFKGKFDHDKTDYPLKGKHATIDCRVCHKGDLTDKLAHNKCNECHKDKHNGDFDTKKLLYPDCASCHNINGFSPSDFTPEQHNKSKFKLEKAHLAQPCFACHKQDKNWVFNNLGTNCVDCHKDIHVGFIDQKYYGKESCNSCHSTESWKKVQFEHKTTGYTLVGGHLNAQCGACHIDKKTNPIKQIFKGLTKKCSDCHKDIHGNQFEINGVTDCAKCHSFNTWKMTHFNHDKTKYKLTGDHKSVSCNKCHKEYLPGSEKIKTFKIKKYECIDCHLK